MRYSEEDMELTEKSGGFAFSCVNCRKEQLIPEASAKKRNLPGRPEEKNGYRSEKVNS